MNAIRRLFDYCRHSPVFKYSQYVLLDLIAAYLLNNVNQLLFNRFSPEAVAAYGSAVQVLTLSNNLYTIIPVGASILIMQFVGAQRRRECDDVYTVSMLDTLVFGLVLSALWYVLTPSVLRLLQLPGALYSHGYSFLSVILGLSFVNGFLTLLAAVFRSCGAMRTVLVVNILINVLYTLLNLAVAFLVPIELQSLGMYAFCAVVAQAFGVALMLFLLRGRTGLRLRFAWKPALLPRIACFSKRILRYGVMGGAESIMYVLAQTAVVALVGLLGERPTLIRAYVCSITPYLMLCSTAVSTAAFYLVGKRYGEGDPAGAKAACRLAIRDSILATVFFCIVFLALARPILRLYTADESLLRDSIRLLYVCAITEVLHCPIVMYVVSLKAVGRVAPPFIAIFPGMALNIVGSYVFGMVLGWGLIGIWMGFILDYIVRGAAMGAVWRRWRPETAPSAQRSDAL